MEKRYPFDELEQLRLTNEEITNAFEQLSALQNLSIEITGSEDIDSIIQSVFSTIPQVVSCQACRFYLFDKDRFILMGEHFYTKVKRCASVDEEVLYWSCKRGSVTVHPGKSENTGTAIAPMTMGSNIIGVILLDLGGQYESYSEVTRIALTTVASHSALALANAQTHRELREKARSLNDVKEYVNGVIASIATPIISMGPNGKIKVFNKKAEEFFQIRSKMVVDNFYSVVLPTYLQELFSNLLLKIQNNEPLEPMEISFSTMYKEPRHALITASALVVSDSQKLGMVCICQDMALSKEVERLKELDKMKDNFIALISNELKTPLSTILNQSNRLLNKKNQTQSETMDRLQSIQREGQRLERLVDNILDTSKIDSGKMEFEFRPFQPFQVIFSSAEALKEWALEKRQTIEVDVDKNLPMGSGDPQRITQVLFNLLCNAIKFTNENGIIHVGAKLTEVSNQDIPSSQLLFYVEDNGKGIKPEHLNQIFDRFSQVTEISPNSEGTGLGLSISQRIVRKHGSQLRVESQLGQGTRFSFTLAVAG